MALKFDLADLKSPPIPPAYKTMVSDCIPIKKIILKYLNVYMFYLNVLWSNSPTCQCWNVRAVPRLGDKGIGPLP